MKTRLVLSVLLLGSLVAAAPTLGFGLLSGFKVSRP
jgi:hypothetical protein